MSLDSDKILKEYDEHIRKVVNITARRFHFKDKAIDDNEDLLQEARMVAWQAIQTYRTDREAQLKTYITRCIRNKLYDFKNRRGRKVERTMTPSDDALELIEVWDSALNESISDYDIQGTLDRTEYDLFTKLQSGYYHNEILETRIFKNREELKSCLARIKRKLTSAGLSPMA